jgi:hypothetical protein
MAIITPQIARTTPLPLLMVNVNFSAHQPFWVEPSPTMVGHIS